jgi:DNA-binding transcriptional ArsR family regulator
MVKQFWLYLSRNLKDLLKINTLEQVRLLSDPLKLDIVQILAEAEQTAADVADRLSEPVTKLYRHIDALLDAALIEVVREQKKRGTIERHFRAAARRFEIEQSLFSEDPEGNDIRSALRAAEDDIVAAVRGGADDNLILSRLRLRGSAERITQLQAELAEWLERVQAMDDLDDSGEIAEAGALIAFYRIDES